MKEREKNVRCFAVTVKKNNKYLRKAPQSPYWPHSFACFQCTAVNFQDPRCVTSHGVGGGVGGRRVRTGVTGQKLLSIAEFCSHPTLGDSENPGKGFCQSWTFPLPGFLCVPTNVWLLVYVENTISPLLIAPSSPPAKGSTRTLAPRIWAPHPWGATCPPRSTNKLVVRNILYACRNSTNTAPHYVPDWI